ncbi:MAG: MFS transporter [Chloroflexi bacterium]|nr:MFS transporter [Chloroflexota bacterium]
MAVQFDITDLAGGRPNAVAIGLVGAAQAVTEMVFAPVLARYADRFGRSRFLVAGPALGVLAALLLALGVTPLQLGTTRLIEGVGAAAFTPVALALIAASTTHDPTVRARASGAFEGATLAGYAGGFLLGPFAWHSLHRGAFLLIAAVYLSAAAVCLRFVPRIPPLPVSGLRSVLRSVTGPGPMRAFLPAWLAGWAMLGAFLANLPALLRHQRVTGQALMHHFDERLISGVLVGWILLFLVGIALWTPLLARSRPLGVMRRALPGAWLVLLGLFALNTLGLDYSPLFVPIVGAGILYLAGFGPAAVNYLADCSEVLQADRAALMSFYTVALAGGGALGAVLGGVAIRLFEADGLLGLGLLLSLVTFGLLVLARRDEAPHLALRPG